MRVSRVSKTKVSYLLLAIGPILSRGLNIGVVEMRFNGTREDAYVYAPRGTSPTL